MKKNILIAVGGTGGHIFPAIAFAEELKEAMPGCSLQFIGGKLESNSYFDKLKYSYCEVSCGQGKKNPFAIIKEAGKIVLGCVQSKRAFSKFKPDLIVGFGSYHSFPVLLAAKLAGIPFILHESNSIPGRVVRYFSKHAKLTAAYFPEVKNLLEGTVRDVRMPMKKNHFADLDVKTARHYYHLEENKFTILVFGGSQGAKIINENFYQAAAHYLKRTFPGLQVIHFAGREEDCKTLGHRYAASGLKAVVKPFEKNMEMAWKAADLVISRAGACTIAELIEFSVPGILIPFAGALDNHQEANAHFVEEKGMSTLLLEEKLIPEALAVAILKTYNRLPEMKEKIHDYKAKNCASSLVEIVREGLWKN